MKSFGCVEYCNITKRYEASWVSILQNRKLIKPVFVVTKDNRHINKGDSEAKKDQLLSYKTARIRYYKIL